jgi:hypothetical protein
MKNDWPSSELQNDEPWEGLVERFKVGVERMQKLVLEVELEKPMAAWGDAPTAQPFIVIAQHNSYHLGQILINRKAQGSWSPPARH